MKPRKGLVWEFRCLLLPLREKAGMRGGATSPSPGPSPIKGEGIAERTIRWLVIGAILFGVFALMGQAQESGGVVHETPYTSPVPLNLTFEQEAQLKLATRKILCACKTCPPTLLDDCLCGTARQLKDGLKAKLLQGQTPEQLIAGYVAEHGEQYLAAPPKEGFNWVIWFFPAVAFVVLGTLFWMAIQRMTLRKATTTASTGPKGDVSRYREEIERQVSRRSV